MSQTNEKIIDGAAIAVQIKEGIKTKIATLRAEGKRAPCLAFILASENPASKTYVKRKKEACKEVGIESIVVTLPAQCSEAELLKNIALLNNDAKIDGILVQLPLAKEITLAHVLLAIDPSKDVDGFHPLNVGKLVLGGLEGFIPCTPKGIIRLLKESHVTISGMHAVIVGRSNIVGKPLGTLLLKEDATVTQAHSKTKELTALCQSADLLIAAIGKQHFIKAEMVKKGAVVIDVGINRPPHSNKITGDVDYETVKEVCSKITPVPNGVGPMTIAMLLENTLESYLRRTI